MTKGGKQGISQGRKEGREKEREVRLCEVRNVINDLGIFCSIKMLNTQLNQWLCQFLWECLCTPSLSLPRVFMHVCARTYARGQWRGEQHLFLKSRETERKQSCTSHTDFGLRSTKAATISREINYDMTRRRPEGAARIHTLHLTSLPSNKKKWRKQLRLYPLHALDSKQNLEQWWSPRKGRGGLRMGGGGIFSFSYMDDSKIPAAFKKKKKKKRRNNPAEAEVPQETRGSFSNLHDGHKDDFLDAKPCNEVTRTYVEKKSQNTRKNIRKIHEDLWRKTGGKNTAAQEELSKWHQVSQEIIVHQKQPSPDTQFLYLLSINAGINPPANGTGAGQRLAMARRGANQRRKAQRSAASETDGGMDWGALSAFEWLLKNRDDQIDFQHWLEWVGVEEWRRLQGVYWDHCHLQVRSLLADHQRARRGDPVEEAVNLQTSEGSRVPAKGNTVRDLDNRKGVLTLMLEPTPLLEGR